MELVIAIAGLVTSLVSLLGVFAVVVRLFTRTEVRLDVAEERGKETAALARTTADAFNGEGRNAHTALSARVTALEQNVARLATIERVDAVLAEMRQGFKHLEDVIKREMRQQEE